MKPEEQRDVLERIREEDVVALAGELVRIPSHYQVPGGETGVARHIGDYLESRGITSRVREVFDGRSNVYGTLEGDRPGPTLLFCGHMDTVLPEGMVHPPFGAELRDGMLWGRGAVDMKGGLAAMLVAMAALKEAGVSLAGSLGFAGVVGEESPNNSEGARALVQDWPVVDLAVVGEPTDLNVAVYHKGMTWLRVHVGGKAGHASHPEDGINAIVVASRIIARLQDQLVPVLASRSHPYVSGPTLSIGRIEGGIQNNIIPDSCWFSLDRRIMPGEQQAEVIREIEEVADDVVRAFPGASFQIEEQPETAGRGPMESGPGRLSRAFSSCGLSVTGTRLPVTGVDYWTDGTHLFRAGAETVVFGPGSISQAHSAEEFIAVSQMTQAARLYALAAMRLLSHDPEENL